MLSNVSSDGAMLKIIAADGGGLQIPSPGTLQRMEDPRAWHARGEMGIQHPRRPAGPAGGGAISLPMAPPLPKGRMVPAKKAVLEEEEYVDRLGEIIEGDYFPHNVKMHRALADLAGHGHSNGGNTPTGTPGSSSVVGTPSSVIGIPAPGRAIPRRGGELGANGVGSGQRPTSNEAGTGGALTKFVATHTSEDNQAFAELQEKDQEAFRRRNFWAYDTTPDGEGVNATSTKLLILPNGKMMSVERREQMDAACADRPKIGDDRPNQVETWKHRTRNQLMFSPNLVASNDICRIEQDPAATAPLLLKGATSKSSTATTKRRSIKQSEEAVRRATRRSQGSAGTEGVLSGPRRTEGEGRPPSLSRGVPGSSASEQTGGEGAAATSSGRLNTGRAASAAAERDTVDDPVRPPLDSDLDEIGSDFGSSRSSQQREDQSSLPAKEPSPPRPALRGTVVVKANPKVIQAHATRFPPPKPRQPSRGPWASPIEKPSSSRESVAELLAGTTEAAGYEEVPMTPSRVPGVDGDSPQITWGAIDGTPMILDPRATPLPGGDGHGSVPGGAMDMASFIGTLGGIGSGRHQFEIKDLPARDKLAHRLEAVDTRRKRAKLGVGAAADGRGTHTPLPATPLTAQTPGSVQRTPGAGKRTPGTMGKETAGGAKMRGSGRTSGKVTPSTPAAQTLAAKLARRQRADTPFGGGLTPGRQKRRPSRLGRGSGMTGDGLTPLPSTPARSATPVAASGKLGAAGGKRSSLTDGLLALK